MENTVVKIENLVKNYAELRALDHLNLEIKEKEVLAIFYGKAVDQDALDAFRTMLNESFPWLEYGFIDGGQDVYDFILAVE